MEKKRTCVQDSQPVCCSKKLKFLIVHVLKLLNSRLDKMDMVGFQDLWVQKAILFGGDVAIRYS